MMHYIRQCLVHMCTLWACTESARPALLHHLQLPSEQGGTVTSPQLHGAKVLNRFQALNTPCLPLILQIASQQHATTFCQVLASIPKGEIRFLLKRSIPAG